MYSDGRGPGSPDGDINTTSVIKLKENVLHQSAGILYTMYSPSYYSLGCWLTNIIRMHNVTQEAQAPLLKINLGENLSTEQ